MAIYHTTFFFTQPPLGWREQYYCSAADLQSALVSAARLAQRRYTILGSGVSLYRAAVSQVGAVRASASAAVGGQTLATAAVDAHQGIEVRVVAGSSGLYHRSFFLGGLPAGAWVQRGRVVQWSAALAGPITSWLGLLIGGTWCLQCWGRSSPTYPLVSLTPVETVPDDQFPSAASADAATPFGATILAVVQGTVAVPVSQPDSCVPPSVRVSGATWTGGPGGHGRGANSEGELVYAAGDVVVYQGVLPASGSYLSGGSVALRPRIYVPITSVTLSRVAGRDVGKARADAITGQTAAQAAATSPVIAPVLSLSGQCLMPGIPADLSPYRTPAGVVPVPPPLVVPPPIPPPPPGPYVPEPMPPRAVTLRQLGDVGVWMRQSVAGQAAGPDYTPIMIGRCLNLVNTYAILLYGMQPVVGGTAGALASIGAGIHAPTAYLTAAAQGLERYVPADAQLLIYGYSLGGIIAELLAASPDYSARITTLVTLASPVAGIPFSSIPVLRFCVGPDLVPELTPLGLLATLLFFSQGLYTFLKPDPTAPGFPACHFAFPTHPGLQAYDTFGLPGSVAPPIELAPLTLLPVPPL